VTETWLLDLDNTLYPASSGLFPLIDARIRQFMVERVGIAPDRVDRLRRLYRDRYGITLPGLMAHQGVDPEEYSAYVHDVPVGEFLSPDPGLASCLAALPGERVVFTNGSTAHAEAVLGRLGVRHLVRRVFDLAFMDYVPKPRTHGYRKVLTALEAEAADCSLVDDRIENLETGATLGMWTVFVGDGDGGRHAKVPRVHDLPRLLLSRGAPRG